MVFWNFRQGIADAFRNGAGIEGKIQIHLLINNLDGEAVWFADEGQDLKIGDSRHFGSELSGMSISLVTKKWVDVSGLNS